MVQEMSELETKLFDELFAWELMKDQATTQLEINCCWRHIFAVNAQLYALGAI